MLFLEKTINIVVKMPDIGIYMYCPEAFLHVVFGWGVRWGGCQMGQSISPISLSRKDFLAASAQVLQ